MRRRRVFCSTGRQFRTSVLLGGVVAGMLAWSPAAALGQESFSGKAPDDWWGSVAPYMWFAGIKGGITTGPFTAPIDASFGDIFGKLKFAFAAHGEAGKGRFFGALDFQTLRVGEDSIPLAAPEVGTSGDFDLSIIQMELFGGYRFGELGGPTRFDLFAGARYTYQDQDLVIRDTPIDKFRGFSETWFDFFAGARIGADLGRRWYVSARADAGAGGSKFTWNGAAGVGFRIIRWLDVNLGFRYLFVDYADGIPGSPTFYAYNADQYGALLGFSFRF